jgi:hypothetical protein
MHEPPYWSVLGYFNYGSEHELYSKLKVLIKEYNTVT